MKIKILFILSVFFNSAYAVDSVFTTGETSPLFYKNSGTIYFYNDKQEIEPSWSFSVSALTDNKIYGSDYPDECTSTEPNTELDYIVKNTENLIKIHPNMDTLMSSSRFFTDRNNFKNNRFRLPKLDIKIANNSQKTLFVDTVKFINIISKKNRNLFFETNTDCHNMFFDAYNINRNYNEKTKSELQKEYDEQRNKKEVHEKLENVKMEFNIFFQKELTLSGYYS